MAGRVDLKKRIAEMMAKISPEAENPMRHIKAANQLIVEAADANISTDELNERLYFLTEGYTEKDPRPAGERLRSILKCTLLP